MERKVQVPGETKAEEQAAEATAVIPKPVVEPSNAELLVEIERLKAALAAQQKNLIGEPEQSTQRPTRDVIGPNGWTKGFI